MTQLAAAVFTLSPQKESPVPDWSGQDARQWFVDTVHRHDPALARDLQNGSGPRPFTTSGLLGVKRARSGATLPPDTRCWLRITTLQDELTALLVERMVPTAAGGTISVADTPYTIETATLDPAEDRGAGTGTDASLIQHHSLSSALPHQLPLHFASPTAFKTGTNAHTLFPTPELVFGSLLTRWNAFNSVTLHPDAQRFATECVAVSRYDLRTSYVRLAVGDRATGFKGFQGFARFVFLRGDRYWRGLINTLATYSFYAGVGASTTMGFGQVRPHQRKPFSAGQDNL